MPIKHCGSGYKWGNHGKCYKSKNKAVRQMKAAFANGYRGESKHTTFTEYQKLLKEIENANSQ